jgi:hypothetical protein
MSVVVTLVSTHIATTIIMRLTPSLAKAKSDQALIRANTPMSIARIFTVFATRVVR